MSDITQTVLDARPVMVVNNDTGKKHLALCSPALSSDVSEPNEQVEILDYWQDEHPDHPVDDWQREVAEGNTRYGYWEWARNQEEGKE